MSYLPYTDKKRSPTIPNVDTVIASVRDILVSPMLSLPKIFMNISSKERYKIALIAIHIVVSNLCKCFLIFPPLLYKSIITRKQLYSNLTHISRIMHFLRLFSTSTPFPNTSLAFISDRKPRKKACRSLFENNTPFLIL